MNSWQRQVILGCDQFGFDTIGTNLLECICNVILSEVKNIKKE